MRFSALGRNKAAENQWKRLLPLPFPARVKKVHSIFGRSKAVLAAVAHWRAGLAFSTTRNTNLVRGVLTGIEDASTGQDCFTACGGSNCS